MATASRATVRTTEHIAAMIDAERETGALYVEPSREAEQAWCDTIQDVAVNNSTFLAECTPGYYNGEGTRKAAATSFTPGPVAFHRLLAEWRTQSMEKVLVRTPDGEPSDHEGSQLASAGQDAA